MSYLQGVKTYFSCLETHWPLHEKNQITWSLAHSFSVEDRVDHVFSAIKQLFPLLPQLLQQPILAHKIECLQMAKMIEGQLVKSAMIKGFDQVICYIRTHVNCLFYHILEEVSHQKQLTRRLSCTHEVFEIAPAYLDPVKAYPLSTIIQQADLAILCEYINNGASTEAILDELHKAAQVLPTSHISHQLLRLMNACNKIIYLDPTKNLLVFTFLLSRLQNEETHGESLFFTRKTYHLPYAVGFDAQKKFACLFKKRNPAQLICKGGEKNIYKAYWINLAEGTMQRGVQVLYKNRFRYERDISEECPITKIRGFISDFFIVVKNSSGCGEYDILAQPLYKSLTDYGELSTSTGCFLSLNEQLRVARDVATALTAMHNGSWDKKAGCTVHADLKTDNVLYSKKEKRAYLIDFGWAYAAEISECHPVLQFVAPSFYITPPEMLKQIRLLKGSGKKGDVWGLGQLLWTLYERTAPSWETSLNTLQEKANLFESHLYPREHVRLLRKKEYGYLERRAALKEQKKIVKWNPPTHSNVEQIYVRLIKKCLHHDPKKRYTAQQVKTILDRLLVKFPSKKSSNRL